MAEILLRVVDKIHADPELNAQQLKSGMVVHVAEDGWAWSRIERSHPEWRILAFPHETIDNINTLLTPQPYTITEIGETPPLLSNPFGCPRAFVLDLNSSLVPVALKRYLNDDARTTPGFTMPADLTIDLFKKAVPMIKNPGEIG